MEQAIVWLLILAVLLVIEAITVGLTTIWFAAGALIAALAACLGGSLMVQLILFFCVSVVLLIFTRPAAVKFMSRNKEKTNVDSLLGKQAVVVRKIDNLAQTGQVRIGDVEWTARTDSDAVTIPENAVVVIEAVRGVKLIVREAADGGRFENGCES